ncbi:MAG TPA: hypothetical protein VIH54_15620, partial [Chthoniobacterales bacterium]
MEGERLTERISQKIFDVLGKAAARSQRAVICASPPPNVPPGKYGVAADAELHLAFDSFLVRQQVEAANVPHITRPGGILTAGVPVVLIQAAGSWLRNSLMPVISPLKSFGVLRAVAGTGVGLGGGADSAIKLGPGVGVALAFAWLPEEGCMAPA